MAVISSVRRRFTRRALLRLTVVYAAAGACYVALAYAGRQGDCAPHEVDGQCGMSTAFGRLYGFAVAGAVIVMYHLRGRPRRRR